MERVVGKLDKIEDHLSNIDVTLAEQAVVLKEHIRRTELLEDAVKPIQAHVDRVDGALRLLGVLALFAGLVATIAKLAGWS